MKIRGVIGMEMLTEPVVCRDGRCRYKDERRDALDRCIDCDLSERIEHDLLK